MTRSAKPPAAPSPATVFPAPDVGDIVWCRFPEHPALHPGPKPRPAIVLAVNDETVPARVRVVYGTSKKTRPVGKGQMVIQKNAAKAFASAGLSYTTRFDFQQVTWLPYTSMWFDLAPSATGGTAATPRMGQLHPSSMNDVARAAKEAGLIPAK